MKTSRDVRALTSDEGAVLRNTKTGVSFGLNPVAADIWRMLQEGKSAEAIVERISVMYEAPAATIESDVRDFIQELQDCELVVADNAS